MRLRILVVVALTTCAALLPSPARAGGWWDNIPLDGQYLGIGETLTLRSEVWFGTMKLAQQARTTDYHAYLLRGVDTSALERAMSRPEPKRWWTPPGEITLVGNVELSRWNSNLAISVAHLTIPEMTPGRYYLMLCDTGCRKPLGHSIPLQVRVSADELAARTARRLQNSKESVTLSLARIRRDLRHAKKQANAAKADAADTSEAIGRLQKRVTLLASDPPSTPWFSYAGWFLSGFVLALAAIRLGRRRSQILPGLPIERVPDDARELVSAK